MKYLKAMVIVGFQENEINEWSEHADVTFALAARGLHNPSNNIYLNNHDSYPKITEKEFAKEHKCITPEGGV